MPYSTEDKTPIQHELFDRFLQLKEGGGMLMLKMYSKTKKFLANMFLTSCAKIDLFRFPLRNTICGSGNITGLAREKPSMVRIVRCS